LAEFGPGIEGDAFEASAVVVLLGHGLALCMVP